jgi:hypothetical protein
VVRGTAATLAVAALLVAAAACASEADGPLGDDGAAGARGGGGREITADQVSTTADPAPGAPTTEPPDAPHYAIGTCVDWDPATAGDPARPGGFAVVACDQPHRGETVGPAADLDTPGHLYPAPDALVDAATRSCVRQAEKYLGDELVDDGPFLLTAMPPTHELWDRGVHTVECVVASRSPAPSQLITGSARGGPQWWVFAPGDCLAFPPTGPDPLGIVPCDQPHEAEIAGTVTLEDRNYDPESAEAIEACLDVATGYLGHVPDPPWLVPMLGPDGQEWADGLRTAYCALVQYDAGDDEPVVVSAPAT